jgi:hypothetical protein
MVTILKIIYNFTCRYVSNMTRRRLLAATTAVSLGIVSGCSTTQDTAEAPPAEGTAEAPATGNDDDNPRADTSTPENNDSTPTNEPTPTPTEIVHEQPLPPEVNDLYSRPEYGVEELGCRQLKPFTKVIREDVYVLVYVGRWAEQECEQFTFVRETYDDDTSTLKLYAEWGVNGNEGCGAECARSKILGIFYDLDYREVNGLELYLAENGNEAELAASWSQ